MREQIKVRQLREGGREGMNIEERVREEEDEEEPGGEGWSD